MPNLFLEIPYLIIIVVVIVVIRIISFQYKIEISLIVQTPHNPFDKQSCKG